MRNKCRFCIHAPVCKYKENIEEIEKLYIPIKNKAVEYPLFECEIRCKQFLRDVPVVKKEVEDDI